MCKLWKGMHLLIVNQNVQPVQKTSAKIKCHSSFFFPRRGWESKNIKNRKKDCFVDIKTHVLI